MKDAIIIFTDGASRGNPGPGGWGGVIMIPDDKRVIEVGGHESNTTNNRMELQAVIESLLAIRQFPGDVIINTDSKYLIQGITSWVKTWIKNGWITSTKEEVQNRDLWELLTSLLYEREEKGKVDWKHVSGHAGVPGNERCDAIATAFADGEDAPLFDDALSNYKHDLMAVMPEGAAQKKEMRDDKKARSKKPAYSYISMVEDEIQTHKTWEECEARVKGKKSAKYKKALSKEEEISIMEEFESLKK